MAEISRQRDEVKYRATLATIASGLLKEDNEGQCLLFLGAGVAVDPTRKHLPTAAGLSEKMAKACGLDWHSYIPLSTIAFSYEYNYKRSQLNAFLAQELDDQAIQPSTTVERLMEIVAALERPPRNPIFVVTTNFDRHFERAYQARLGRWPEVIIYNGGVDANKDEPIYSGRPVNLNWFPGRQTFLFKMHGCISQPGDRNLVVTEEDYINFLSNAVSYDPRRKLLTYAMMRFSECPILFVGYSLSDWNFRFVFKATAERSGRDCYAVQYLPNPTPAQRTAWDAVIDFWGRKRVDIINEDGAVFMRDLLESVNHERNQRERAGAAAGG